MGVAESIQDIDSEHAKINSAQPLYYHTKSIVKIKIGINIGINIGVNIGINPRVFSLQAARYVTLSKRAAFPSW